MKATLLSMLLAIFIAAISGCGGSPDLSLETHAKLKIGMTLDEVEGIIGARAKTASESVIREVNTRAQRFGQPSPAKDRGGTTKYVFHAGNAWLFVDIDDKTGKVVGINRWASSSGKGLRRSATPY